MNKNNYLEGFCQEDSKMTVEYPKTNKSVIFDCFCGSVSAIEAETHRKDGLAQIGDRPLSFGANRTLQLVSDFDNFVNAPDFKMGIYSVGKLEMENFWRFIGQKNQYAISNKGTTYGGSSIWVITKGKSVFGFLLNNMTFDGQNSYFMFSIKEKQHGDTVLTNKGAVKRLFTSNNKYPAELGHNGQHLTRFGKITQKIASNGETAIGAWSVLKSEDSRFFYGELKKHNWLNQSDKQLLKAIKKTRKPMSFDCLIEATEDRKSELEAKIAEYYNSEEAQFPISDLVHYEWELEEINSNLSDWTEEDNSLSSISELDDYYPSNYQTIY